MVNALSIDVEDYFQVSAAEDIVRYEEWDRYESRVVENTRNVLGMLEGFNTKATFFILGWTAERFPELVKEIYSQGHKIASHGYRHQLVYEQEPELFREDIRKARRILEEITGGKVIGYRAPSFSITDKSLWALEILKEEGFLYDSSIFPIRHDRYGIADAKRFIHKIDLGERGEVVEFPISTLRIFGANFPFAGGGYLRLLPAGVVKWGIKRLNKEGHPAIVYIHPWEIDPDQPRLKLRGLSGFRHYVNLSRNAAKLKNLFSDLKFSSIEEVVGFG